MNHARKDRPLPEPPQRLPEQLDSQFDLRDRQMLRQLLDGDTQTFFRVVHHCQTSLLGYLDQWVVDRHQAQDILQEVFLRLHRSCQLKSITVKTNLRAYLFTIARNCAIDHHRRESGHRQKLNNAASQHVEPAICDPHDTVSQQETSQQAQVLLENLPLEQREVIVLQIHSGLKLREIAEVLGIPLGTVKSRMRAGLGKIHDQLQEKESSYV